MKTHIHLLFIATVCLVAIDANAQRSVNVVGDTVQWNYGSGLNKARSNESMSITGYFISYGDKTMVWVQNGTDTKYTFDIKQVEGAWTDSNKQGQIVYQAVCDGISGTIKIYRDASGLAIHLDFAKPDKLTPNIVLPVVSVTKR